MIFSEKKLREMANLPSNITLEKIVNTINLIGFEVENVTSFTDVEGIMFGKITKMYKNPNADNLNVCEIKFKDKNRIIQTTATNVFEGMVVIVFVPGSRVGKTVFEEKKFKGIVSEGMLSSLNEFGINKELLWDGATKGIQHYEGCSIEDDPIEKLKLNDSLIEVNFMPNRTDAISYLVMAKELAAYFNTIESKIEKNKPSFKSDLKVEENLHQKLVLIESKTKPKITIEDKLLLIKSNIKSINDIVDLTNLTLIMTGQPTHAYDKNLVNKNFSTKYSNEKINIIGNKEIKLDHNLVITSNDKPVSLAGVIGFTNSVINKNTQEFILEFGQFENKDIRKNIKTIKLESNSGIQSSKSLSGGMLKFAIDFVASKLNNFSHPVNFKEDSQKVINFDQKKLDQIAGFNLTKTEKYQEVMNSLKKLGFEFFENMVKIPTYRYDVNQQQDLNEEILRFYGYELLPEIKPQIKFSRPTLDNSFKNLIAAQGYNEVFTYSLISKEKNVYNPFNFDKKIKLKTFVSKEREVIRDSQIYSILEILNYNLKKNIKDINVFSCGMINDGVKTIIMASTIKNFMEVKKDVVNLLPKEIIFKVSKDENMHPNYSADIYLKNQKIGFIGKINPKNTNVDAIICEFYEKKYVNKKFIDYKNEVLKAIDITFELNKKENIQNKIKDIKFHFHKIIDQFDKANKRKITVRFVGTKEEIKKINVKYNQ